MNNTLANKSAESKNTAIQFAKNFFMGLVVTVLAGIMGLLNWSFMLRFHLLFAFYGSVLTVTAFFQRIYTQKLRISRQDIVRAVLMCVVENVFFRFILDWVRFTALIGYRKKKNTWGQIKRIKHSETR